MTTKQEWKLVPIEPTEEMLRAAWGNVANIGDLGSDYKKMLAAAPTPSAAEDDVNGFTSNPVVAHETGNIDDKQDREVGILYVSLFRRHLENTHFDYYGDLPEGSHELYTRPADDKLRKAAEALTHYMEQVGRDFSLDALDHLHKNLRAALEPETRKEPQK